MDQLEMLLHDAVEQFQLQAAAPAVAKTKSEAPSKVMAVMQPRQQARARQLFRTFVKSICIKKRVESRPCLYCFARNSVMHVGQKNLIFGLSI